MAVTERPTNSTPEAGKRDTFGVAELAIVLSHYDIGIIKRVREFNRGSRKAPKLVIESSSGTYLLKRRARGRDDVQKVAFTHAMQLHLIAQQYPLPHLIGTRTDNNSMLMLDSQIYELFEYIPGENYPGSLDATFESGRILSLFHKLLEDFHTDYQPATGSYHNAPAIEKGLKEIAERLPGAAKSCHDLIDAYREAANKVQSLGFEDWPRQIVHGDWHPGNMLFREDRIVAVIDYDSARRLPKCIDTANGALQFSILGGGEELSEWPEYLDETRFKRFIRGYDQVQLLSQAELSAVPFLMIEGLIAEAVFPIAATGRFARFDGTAFLKMVVRKTRWLKEKSGHLVALVEG